MIPNPLQKLTIAMNFLHLGCLRVGDGFLRVWPWSPCVEWFPNLGVICTAVVDWEISGRSGYDAAIRSEGRFAEIVELIGWRRNTVSGEITVRVKGLRDMHGCRGWIEWKGYHPWRWRGRQLLCQRSWSLRKLHSDFKNSVHQMILLYIIQAMKSDKFIYFQHLRRQLQDTNKDVAIHDPLQAYNNVKIHLI